MTVRWFARPAVSVFRVGGGQAERPAVVPGERRVVAVFVTLVWLVTAVRFLRLEPSGPSGYPPGGAGVREPRRPKPRRPADAIALPTPDDAPSDAIAWA
ncbi:hypothetical protein ACFXJ5_33275 [Streptomyces sp. NPDC059373]